MGLDPEGRLMRIEATHAGVPKTIVGERCLAMMLEKAFRTSSKQIGFGGLSEPLLKVALR
jgi:hypothetical protein